MKNYIMVFFIILFVVGLVYGFYKHYRSAEVLDNVFEKLKEDKDKVTLDNVNDYINIEPTASVDIDGFIGVSFTTTEMFLIDNKFYSRLMLIFSDNKLIRIVYQKSKKVEYITVN